MVFSDKKIQEIRHHSITKAVHQIADGASPDKTLAQPRPPLARGVFLSINQERAQDNETRHNKKGILAFENAEGGACVFVMGEGKKRQQRHLFIELKMVT